MSLASKFRNLLTVISPTLHAYVVYFFKYKKPLHLNPPKTFSEKVIWLKLKDYNSNPLVKQCADKYAVRGYVEEKGLKSLLNDLIGVYDSPEEIKWDELPDRFAIKLNTGCGCNYICKDKSAQDERQVYDKLHSWMKTNHWIGYAEMQYKTEKKLLVEKYLSDSSGNPPVDYKVYCFNGKPVLVFYLCGRFSGEMHGGFFDPDWNYLGIGREAYIKPLTEDEIPKRPRSLETMFDAAKKLSQPFPFVRIDFYDVDGRAMFGEMTFTPRGGFEVSECDINGKTMAELLTLPSKK